MSGSGKHSEKWKIIKQLWSLKMKIIQNPENWMTNHSYRLKAPWKRSEGEAKGRRKRQEKNQVSGNNRCGGTD